MQQLTPTQLHAIQSLIEHPCIKAVRIEIFSNSLTHVSVDSEVGADFNLVDMAIQTLNEIFNLEYRDEACSYLNPVDGKQTELYTLDWDGEALISLSMRSEPEPVVWDLEAIMRREG